MIHRLVRSVLRAALQTRDANFIGFSKYRQNGPYHWKTISENSEYRSKVELVLAHVERDFACLDVGCGDGAYIGSVAPHCRYVVGIDADFDAVRLARRQLAKHGIRNCLVMQSALGKLSEKELQLGEIEKFDVVYSMDVLEHLPDPEELVRVATARCRPEGTVIIGTPVFISTELVSPYHVKEFSAEELDGMIGRHLCEWKSLTLPSKRQDGNEYPHGYYVAIGSPAEIEVTRSTKRARRG